MSIETAGYLTLPVFQYGWLEVVVLRYIRFGCVHVYPQGLCLVPFVLMVLLWTLRSSDYYLAAAALVIIPVLLVIISSWWGTAGERASAKTRSYVLQNTNIRRFMDPSSAERPGTASLGHPPSAAD